MRNSDPKQVYLTGFSQIDFEENPRLMQILRLAQENIDIRPSARILDIGCGDGKYTQALGSALKTEKLFGVDFSPEAVRLASKMGVDAHSCDVDNSELPFEDGTFDVVYCGSLIELVIDGDHLLEEIHRVLSPQGTLIITSPNLASWGSRIAVLLGYHPFYDRISRKYNMGKLFVPPTKGDSTGFIRLLTLRSFRELLDLYDFEVLSSHGARDNNLPGVIQLFDRFFSRFPSLAFQMICIAKKKS
jgi:SAM-dependent methyltransferase